MSFGRTDPRGTPATLLVDAAQYVPSWTPSAFRGKDELVHWGACCRTCCQKEKLCWAEAGDTKSSMTRARWGTLVLALWMVDGAALAQWSPEVRLSPGSGDFYGEGIAASGNTVHVVYGTSDIRHRRSLDEGATWSSEVTVGTGTIHLTDPLVADGNDAWVVYLANVQNFSDWCCVRDGGAVTLRRSRDAGLTWDAPIPLSTPSTAFRLSLAYAAGRLHLVWMDYRSGSWDTYYRRSVDRGATWEPEVVIAASMGVFGAERPQVAARGDSVHVTIWDDRANNGPCAPGTFSFTRCPDTFHMRSTNGGVTWGPMVNVANGGIYFSGRNDVAVAGANGVVINFNVDVAGETGSKLFAVASQDDGATWGTPVRLTLSANGSDHGSIVGGAADDVHLVWHDDRNATNREVYYRRSLNAGVSWEAEEQVSPGLAGDSSTPLNAVTPGYAQVIWIDNRGSGYQVYHRRRQLNGMPPDGGVVDAGGLSSSSSGGGGPLAWWRLDETSGTTVVDATGNGHTGTLTGGGAFGAGRIMGALNLAGTNGYVAVASFPPPSSLTLMAWVNPVDNTGMDSIILNKNNNEYDFRISATGALSGSFGGTALVAPTVNLYANGMAGTWRHAAYVFDGVAQTHTLYLDGAPVASAPNTASPQATANGLRLGRHSQFDFGTFQGALDEVKIHDRALAAGEVAAEYAGTGASSSSSAGASTGGTSSSGPTASSGVSSSVGSSAAGSGSSGGGGSSSAGASSSNGSGARSSSAAGTSSGSGGSSGSATAPAGSSTGGNGNDGGGDGCACHSAQAPAAAWWAAVLMVCWRWRGNKRKK